ncbi:MAG: o-succinylbenzoate synthase [Flavobacteriales bacterium]|nr:o-succinylbenzoate synthase [Flavobacteriales bacterium]
MKASWHKHTLIFDRPRGTSRGWFKEKPSWFIKLEDEKTGRQGIGECGLLPGLSVDDKPDYEQMLDHVVDAINGQLPFPVLKSWPSINFGLEMAQRHFDNGGFSELFPSAFSAGESGIEINGLIWMGDPKTMKGEIAEKLDAGFTCVKLKIGAVDFDEELALIEMIRKEFSPAEVVIRVDANGAFSPAEARDKLNRLAAFDLHSIEQPIKAGQWEEMAALCANTPIDIALDEELIGLHDFASRKKMVETIKPQAIILKPSLIGGFRDSDEWILLAENVGGYWWLTSALESNIGLNAIAQFAAHKEVEIPQGLGTGQLYTNNIDSPLEVEANKIYYRRGKKWAIPF